MQNTIPLLVLYHMQKFMYMLILLNLN